MKTIFKRIFFSVSLFFSAATMMADIKYDAFNGSFYTVPASSSINLNEYNALIAQVAIMEIQLMNSGVYGKRKNQQTASYLKALNTPTALRLLADLEKDK
jgi:hypothetical protein